MVSILVPTKSPSICNWYTGTALVKSVYTSHLSGQVKTFHQSGFVKTNSWNAGGTGRERKNPRVFFSVKLGKTAQPSSKSAGLSWLSRLRRGLCHCVLCGGRFLQRSLKAGLFPNTRNAASCGANCKNYKSKETPVLVCHCKNEWSSTSQKWAMYTVYYILLHR